MQEKKWADWIKTWKKGITLRRKQKEQADEILKMPAYFSAPVCSAKYCPPTICKKQKGCPLAPKALLTALLQKSPPPEHDPIEYIFVVWPKTLQKTEFTRFFIRGAMWNKKETGTFMIFTQIRLTLSKLYHGYTNKSRLACLSCRYCYCSGHIL